MNGLASSFCVLCGWSGTYDWSVSNEDIEVMIEDHLDTDHPGWTLEQLRESRFRPRSRPPVAVSKVENS